MKMINPAATRIMVRKFNCGYTTWDCATFITSKSGITIGKLAESLEGRGFYDPGDENGKVAGFASRYHHPSDDCHTCSILGDPRVCCKAAKSA